MDNLDKYRGSAGAFFAGLTKNELKAADVSDLLLAHIETLTGTIDALADALVA